MADSSVPPDEVLLLRKDYLEDLRERIALIRHHGEALRSKKAFRASYPVLLYTAHQIKGSGGTLGFPRISELGETLSVKLNDFIDESTPRPSADQLSSTVLTVAGELESAIDAATQSL